LAVLWPAWVLAQEVPPPPGQQMAPAQPFPPPAPTGEGQEVLTRGPVHEAFAQPVLYTPTPGITVPQPPPAPVTEEPPDQAPQVADVQWIPGYWSWDADARDYIWVSGTWRVPPPGCSWVPGYWVQSAQGYQWVPGFWTPGEAQEVQYLPQPPANLEEGPPAEGASSDTIWVPGHWVWSTNRYLWRHGVYVRAQANWVYNPACYYWTPNGYVFAEGHWDYPMHGRGVLFAPVDFVQPVYEQAGYVYSPSVVVDIDALTSSLFCQPQYDSYFFGDYYSRRYAREGYYPWYEAREHRYWYDPIFFHQEWQHRNEHDWYNNLHAEYDHCVSDKNLRPAHTWREEQQRVAKLPAAQRSKAMLAQPLNEYVRSNRTPMKFAALPQARRQEEAQRAKDVHQYAQARSRWEAPAAQQHPEAGRPQAGRPEAGHPEAARPEAGRPEAGRPEAARPEAVRPEAERPQAARPEAARPEAGHPEAAHPAPGRPPAEARRTESEGPRTVKTPTRAPVRGQATEQAKSPARPEMPAPEEPPQPERRGSKSKG
jgi:hypothetical protein